MSEIDIVRAWKDETYRESLTAAERASLPQNPAGLIELGDADLVGVAGGILTINIICESLFRCTFGGDCPSIIYTLCGTFPIGCCIPLV